jgi:dihydroorotase-like cyclic amidohydrolase
MILIKNCSYVLACADKVLNNVDILIKDNKIEKIDRNISQEGCKKVISGKVKS